MTIELKPINENNLSLGVETAVTIFGERDREAIEREFGASAGRASEENAARTELHIVNPHYFIAAGADGRPVGVTGYYSIEGHEEDAWLGWMGILPEHRAHGFGSEMVRQSFAWAARNSTENLRIWTTLEPDYDAARRLYTKMGFVEEPYRPGATDGARLVVVFSKSAGAHDVALWRDAAYPIDCDHHVIAELTESMLHAGPGIGNPAPSP